MQMISSLRILEEKCMLDAQKKKEWERNAHN